MFRSNKSIIESDIVEIRSLPQDFHTKLNDLELKLERGSLTHEGLKELFECYSTASSYYEAIDFSDNFQLYIKKMQDLLKNDKIQPLLKRRNSRELIEKLELTVEQKKDQIEKIKTMIKDTNTKKNVKEATNNLIENFNKKENSNNDLIHKDIAGQEENFKKRLEEKKLFRTSSQPHMGFRSNKIKQKLNKEMIDQKISDEIKINSKESERIENSKIGYRKKSSITNSQSPAKRRSRIENHEEEINSLNGILTYLKNSSLNLAIKNSLSKNSNLKNLHSDSIFDQKHFANFKLTAITNDDKNQIDTNEAEYSEKIMSDLNEIYDKAEKKFLEELENIQNEIEKFMENLFEEKLFKTLEINQKYEVELKELETDLDLSDETNINTIIYNDIKKDRENEKKDYYAELEIKKQEGIAELKQKSLNIINDYKNGEEIRKIKENIAKNIKEKIIKSLHQKPNLNEKIDKANIDGECIENFEDEIIDSVKECDISLAKGLKKCATEKYSFNKPVLLSKRVSKGYIGNLQFKENLSEDVKEN